MTHSRILSNIGLPMSIWRASSRNWTSFIVPNENRRGLSWIVGQEIQPNRGERLHNGIWRDSIFDLGDATERWNILTRYGALIPNCRPSLRRFWNLPNSNWK